MPRFGFGFGAFGPKQFTAGPVAVGGGSAPPVSPASAWTGVAGSGFSTVPPDPVRTTAKPALRLLVPPNQAYTDELLVGVYAAANNGGTLIPDMGIDRVIAHFEGSSVVIPAYSFETFPDANGNDVTYCGWWIRLAHNGLHGLADLYFEAVPVDSSMQNRVIGPYTFLPAASLHDYSVEVAPSQAEIAGARYQTIRSALLYLADQNAAHSLITITESGQYDIANARQYTPAGYCTLTASVPVTIVKGAYTNDVASQVRPLFGGLRFKGSNITFDIRNVSQVRGDGPLPLWFDGIRATNSLGTRYALWRKGMRPVGFFASGTPYFTECDFELVPNAANLAALARGNNFRMGFGDVFGDGQCMIGNRVDDWDTAQEWQVDVDAFTVTYTGAEATATIEVQNHNEASPRPIVAKWGSNTATFVVGSLETYATGAAGDGYSVQDVVDWLNGLPGWSATVLDDTRRASAMSLPGLKGAPVPPTDVKDTTVRFVTCFDNHGDFYQDRWGGVAENVVIADNLVTNFRGQDLFFSAVTAMHDYFAINNAIHNKTTASQYAENLQTFSQLYGPQSHIVWAHNTLASQGALLRPGAPQNYAPDGYCLVANNAIRSIGWTGTPVQVAIANNHLQDGFADPQGAVGTTIGGTEASLFASAGTGNFTPIGALLADLKTPIVAFDRAGVQRAAKAPVGAIAT